MQNDHKVPFLGHRTATYKQKKQKQNKKNQVNIVTVTENNTTKTLE